MGGGQIKRFDIRTNPDTGVAVIPISNFKADADDLTQQEITKILGEAKALQQQLTANTVEKGSRKRTELFSNLKVFFRARPCTRPASSW